MTRKRFIKLAMSYGIQRNQVNTLARALQPSQSYQQLYHKYNLAFVFFKSSKAVTKLRNFMEHRLKRVWHSSDFVKTETEESNGTGNK